MASPHFRVLLLVTLALAQEGLDTEGEEFLSAARPCRSKLCAWRKEKFLQPENSTSSQQDGPGGGLARDHAPSSEERRCKKLECNDNQDLPIHPARIALLVSGLTQPVTSLMLSSVMREIVQPLGSDGVHVFVHTTASFTEDWGVGKQKAWRGNAPDDAVAKIYTSVLGECLRLLVVDRHYHSAEKVYTGMPPGEKCAGQAREECISSTVKGEQAWLPRSWRDPNPLTCRMQFFRLRELYPHVLAEEKVLKSRYSHLVRLRTDAIWYRPWNFRFVADINPQSRMVALPRGDAPGSDMVPDSFWISSRGAAHAAFSGFADFLQQPIDRKEIFDLFNCTWPLEGAEGSEHSDHAFGGEDGAAGTGLRGGLRDDNNSAFCREQILVAGAIWPEALVKYYFRSRFDVVDSCGLIGPYLSVQGWFKGGIDIADVCKLNTASPYHVLSTTLLIYQINSMLKVSPTLDLHGALEALKKRLRSMAGDRREWVLSEAARLDVDMSLLQMEED